MLCALIMAGGKGERFWPLSTDDKPKQFLKLINNDTMIQMTVKRIEKLIPIERVFIVTGRRYVNLVKEQLPSLPEKNIIVEPIGKNTAPCIALSAFMIDKFYKNATIAVLPSDHLIQDEERFVNILSSSYKFIEKNEKAIITLGMKPDRAETGYGYIEYEESFVEFDENCIKKVHRFVEKPSFEVAEQYLEQGNFLWNGGMFIWKTSNILRLTEKFLSKTYSVLNEIAITKDNFDSVLNEKYKTLESVSVDYGIMEKADDIYVIPSDFGWDDVGTWHSVERIREKDINNNICSGENKLIDSHNNILLSSSKPIAIVGVDNLFVVESDELIFITYKDSIDNIKYIKNRIAYDSDINN